MVWGRGDPTLLPRLLARVRGGQLVLPGGGRAPVSGTHVDTLVATVLAALERPAVRGPINVADAAPIAPADLLRATFAAAGTPVRIGAIPGPIAEMAAVATELLWRAARRGDEPPLTRYAVAAFTRPLILDLTRLHLTLGPPPAIDPIALATGLLTSTPPGGIDPARPTDA